MKKNLGDRYDQYFTSTQAENLTGGPSEFIHYSEALLDAQITDPSLYASHKERYAFSFLRRFMTYRPEGVTTGL